MGGQKRGSRGDQGREVVAVVAVAKGLALAKAGCVRWARADLI